jgi:hypothetical protein
MNLHPWTPDELEAQRATDRALAELEDADAALELALLELEGNVAALLELVPLAPVLDALDDRWPDGWHGSSSLHPYDHTPADELRDEAGDA